MTKCRVCKTAIIKFFSLGKMPFVNAFRKTKSIVKEKKYDLSVGFCPKCFLVQLMKTVDPDELFRNYIYFSSNVQSILDHNRKTATYLTKRLKLSKNSLVLEIGSNDGAYLQYYKALGIPVLGIDPAKNIAKVANKNGIPTIADFFNLQLAKKLVKTKSFSADVVYGANVFAHVPEIVDLVQGIKVILKAKGTAIFESPYLKGLLENKFDTIYHEHVFYYSLISLQNLFKQADMEIYDIEFVDMQGGSLRIYVSHRGAHTVSERVKKLAAKELYEGFHKLKTYQKMNERVETLKRDIHTLLKKLKKEKKQIVGYSAPAKGVILLNYFNISIYLDFIVDKSKTKQGLYIPGTSMKVFPIEKIMKEKPDYIFVFCWNIEKEVIKQMHVYKKAGGKFIIPIPILKIH